MSHDLIRIGFELMQKDLGLEADFDKVPSLNHNRLKEWLSSWVSQKLDSDFNGLLNTLYRVDVDEMQVKRILNEERPENLSSSLAELILLRFMEKAKWRMKYSK